MQIILEIENGKTKSDVSRKLGLASSTVATIWKNRDNIISAYNTENHAQQGMQDSGEGSFYNETGKIKCPTENSVYFSSSYLTVCLKIFKVWCQFFYFIYFFFYQLPTNKLFCVRDSIMRTLHYKLSEKRMIL